MNAILSIFNFLREYFLTAAKLYCLALITSWVLPLTAAMVFIYSPQWGWKGVAIMTPIAVVAVCVFLSVGIAIDQDNRPMDENYFKSEPEMTAAETRRAFWLGNPVCGPIVAAVLFFRWLLRIGNRLTCAARR